MSSNHIEPGDETMELKNELFDANERIEEYRRTVTSLNESCESSRLTIVGLMAERDAARTELAQCERLNQEVSLLADQMREQRNEARAERDALKAKLARYFMDAGHADQMRGEAIAARVALGFSVESGDVSPSCLTEAVAKLKAERDQFRLEWDAANARCNTFAAGFHERNGLLRKAESERDAARAQAQKLREALEGLVDRIDGAYDEVGETTTRDAKAALAALAGPPSEPQPCPRCEEMKGALTAMASERLALVSALMWLNQKGGLGLDVHDAIRAALSKAGAK